MISKIQIAILSALAAIGLSWGASPEGRAAYPEKPYSDAEIMEMAISSVEKAAPYARQLFRSSLTNAQGRVTPPFAVSFKLDEIRALSDWTTWAGFLAKENRIPKGFTRAELVAKCREGVNYATRSHVAIKRIQMATDLGKPYWGSDARNGKNLARRWQSALWAGQIGFAASFVWDVLTAEEKRDVHDMLAAELRDLILRRVPTGFVADTKCEGYLFAYAIARGQVKNVCGIFAPLDPATAKTLVPMRQGAAGNFTGWYGVEGRNWNARLVDKPSIETRKDGVTIRESLLMCDGALRDDCEIVADPKGVTVTERVTACKACKVYRQFPARVAVSRDVTGPQPPGFTNRVNIVSLTGGQPYWGRNLCERSIDYNWYSPACRTNEVALKVGETLPVSQVRFEPASGRR